MSYGRFFRVLIPVLVCYANTWVLNAAQMPDGAMIATNIAYRGSISIADEKDWYKFDVSPDNRYYIVVWADNTFGTNPNGLLDTELRAYYLNSDLEVTAFGNTDGPTWANLGFGSMIVMEAVPEGVASTKKNQCYAPSSITFYIAQESSAPETGTYTFKVFVDSIPHNEDGTVNYAAGSSTYLFSGPINPPVHAEAAPGEDGIPLPLLTSTTGIDQPFDTDTPTDEAFGSGDSSCFLSTVAEVRSASWVSWIVAGLAVLVSFRFGRSNMND